MKRTSVKRIPANTLRAHLAQNQSADPRPDSPHPDADLLAAFAEDTLLDRERTGILAHLAACPHCRAIIHTAAASEPDRQSEELLESVPAHSSLSDSVPAYIPTAAAPPERRPVRSAFRAWFPGVALAASLIVMAATTIVFYRALHTHPAPTQTAATIPALRQPAFQQPSSPTVPINTATIAASAAPPPATHKHKHTPAPAPSTVAPVLQSEDARLRAATSSSPAPAAGAFSSRSFGDLSQQRAQNSPPAEQAQLHAQMQAQMVARRSAVAQANATQRSSTPPSSTQSVQVAPGSASAVLQTTHPAAGFIPAPRPRFRITDNGRLERSVQSSIWMPVAVAEGVQLRVVCISGADVWAGGNHLRLFHSSDNGLTWTEVHLPASADRAHAIVHIRIDGPQHLTVTDDTGSAWTTADAGATWQ